MATSASQTYLARLGFQDPDRRNARHGHACEYLFERLVRLEAGPYYQRDRERELELRIGELAQWADRCSQSKQELQQCQHELAQLPPHYGLNKAAATLKPADCINSAIVPSRSSWVAGFADVLLRLDSNSAVLGEVKITKQSAEEVLQQVNFYQANLPAVSTVYILADYDCADLQRLTQGSRIKVFRLGQRFEDWLATRTSPCIEEL